MADVPELEATLFRNSRLERIAANRSTGPLLPGVYAGTVHGLASHAIVVRGGLMREGDLAKSAEKFWRRHDRYGISVFASDTKSLAQIVEAGRIPYRQVRLATAGSLAAAGFVLTKTSGPDHYTLELGDTVPTSRLWERLLQEFSPLVNSPVPDEMRRLWSE